MYDVGDKWEGGGGGLGEACVCDVWDTVCLIGVRIHVLCCSSTSTSTTAGLRSKPRSCM